MSLISLYPQYRAVIENSRERRMAESLSLLSPERREALLRTYHPDYLEGAHRVLQVGPNGGERTVHELADLLEADSPLDSAATDLSPQHTVDVLVLGGGGAGCTAALVAKESGASVLLATKLRMGDSNTVMAEGGIQAAVGKDDTPVQHFLDALAGGHFKNDPELLRILVEEGPEAVQWLAGLGVLFDREADGTLRRKMGGGTTRERLLACRDYTGLDIMRALKESMLGEGIRVLEYAPAVELLSDPEGRCAGAVLRTFDPEALVVVYARAVVLATGGSGRLHIQGFPTSNHFGATGDAMPMAYRMGARLTCIDTFQYHPTGVIYPGYLAGMLITEGMRSMGGQLLNARGERFVNELETRDVAASAVIRECREGRGVQTPSGKVGVWLDTPIIDRIHGEGTVADHFPNMLHQFVRCGIDIRQEAVLVYPTLHYQNGGIQINAHGESSAPNLFVAGEATGGIHGRNRLMGNSLLDVFVFGLRAGRAVAERAGKESPGKPGLGHVRRFREALREAGIEPETVSPMVLPPYATRESVNG